MEILEPKPRGTLWATPGLLRDPFTFYLKISVRVSNSEAKDFLFSKIVHNACGAHVPFYSLGIGVTSLGVKWPERELTAYLHLVLGLTTSGPITVNPL